MILCNTILLFATVALTGVDPTPTTHQASVRSQAVYVGIYLLDIPKFDIKENSYIAELDLWFRWHGDIDPTDFEFMNGTVLYKSTPDSRTINGEKYLAYRCRVDFHDHLNLEGYPLDAHLLTIQLEDSANDADSLVYVPDREDTGIDPQVYVSGFILGQLTCEVVPHEYGTNYGIPTTRSAKRAPYSRFVCQLQIKHHRIGAYLKNFLACFISVGIAMLAFAVRPTDDPRFGVGIGGVFGVVSSYIVVGQSLPEVSYLTLVDKIHLLGLLFVFFSLLASCVSLRFMHQNRELASKRLDRCLGLSLPTAFIVVVVALTAVALR